MLAHPHLFKVPHYLPLDEAPDISVQLTSMSPVFLKQRHPFQEESHPLSGPGVQGRNCDPVWPIRIPTCPGHCDWLKRWSHDPSLSNRSQRLGQEPPSLLMAVKLEPGDAGGRLATQRGAPTRQRLDSGNTHVRDHTTPEASSYPWAPANTFLSQSELHVSIPCS